MTETELTPRERLLIKCRDAARKRFWSYYDRARFECQSCGQQSHRIEVHHKDGDPLNNHMVNLVGLCYRCHKHSHRAIRRKESLETWKARFENLGSA